MSFSSDVRLELAHAPCEKRGDALSELCAVILTCGGLSFKGPGRYGLSIQSESQAVVERYISMLKRFLGADSEMHTRHTDRLGGQTHFVLSPDPGAVNAILTALDLLDPGMPFGMRSAPGEAQLQSEGARRAFLRGAFLIGGWVNDPEKAYHLEFTSGNSELAQTILSLVTRFSLPARLTQRKAQYVAYVKNAETVSDLLALLGASKAVMALENVRVVKGVRNGVNRQVNCDQNNLDKVVAASARQISMIRAIEKRIGMEALPEGLRQIAALRLQNPDATLTELGQLAVPELGKSGVNARMRKLEALAEELVNM